MTELTGRIGRSSRVAVVVITYQHAHFLGAGLDSIAAQTRPADKVIVVDDGSTDDPGAVVADRAGVRLVHQLNAGPAAARNRGLREVDAEFVVFLDADDLLTPMALAAGLRCFRRRPDAAFVYGAHRRTDADGQATTGTLYQPLGSDALGSLLRGNVVGMHGTVMYRVEALRSAGGFDETLPRCDDYDVYLRLAKQHSIASHPHVVALYRWHGANVSGDYRRELRSALEVHRRHRPPLREGRALRRAWREGRRNWRRFYSDAALEPPHAPRLPVARALVRARVSPADVALRSLARARTRVADRLLSGDLHLARRHAHRLGSVRLGDLDRVEPISLDFGRDRGQPIDRYYIEQFLASCADDIRGRVLEVGDATYSERFGGARVTHQDVLHADSRLTPITITGDLSRPGVLPIEVFDCIVLTETLQFIYELPVALRHLHAALKPGGVLLVTVPGIRQIDRGAWGEQWYWALTPQAARRLLEEVFGEGQIEVEAYGNVFAAITLLTGLAQSEVDLEKLDVTDPAYPVVVAARAVRPDDERHRPSS